MEIISIGRFLLFLPESCVVFIMAISRRRRSINRSSDERNFAMRIFGSRVVVVVMLGAAVAGRAEADLVIYNSSTAFTAASSGLVLDNFSNANVAAGSSATMTGPLNSSTNNSIFSTGSIVAGLQIDVPGANNLFVAAPGFANYTNYSISFNLEPIPVGRRIDT
jgi:hypothetical protein